MTTGQVIAIIIAVVGGDGIWRVLEHRLSRKDQLKDRKHLSIADLEADLEKCSKACLRLLAFNLYAWQENVMARHERNIGVNEWRVMNGQYESYKGFGGNGTVESRQLWIKENFEQIPDIDLDNSNTIERREVI